MNDPNNLSQLLSINDHDLDTEMVQYPATLGYWNAQLADSLRKLLIADHARDTVQARVEIIIRAEALDAEEAAAAEEAEASFLADSKTKAKPKKKRRGATTEASVKAAVVTHSEVQAAEHVFINAKVEYERIRGICAALSSKGDFLRSLGARIRAELERDPSVRTRYENHRQVESLRRDNGVFNDPRQGDLDL
jgi:hypothetical protein